MKKFLLFVVALLALPACDCCKKDSKGHDEKATVAVNYQNDNALMAMNDAPKDAMPATVTPETNPETPTTVTPEAHSSSAPVEDHTDAKDFENPHVTNQ